VGVNLDRHTGCGSEFRIDSLLTSLLYNSTRFIGYSAISSYPLMNFTIGRDERRGRHALATKNFTAGTIILTETSHAHMSTSSNLSLRCLNCLATTTPSGSSLSCCAQCKTAAYCSRACQTKDWQSHHKLECKHMKAGSEFNRFVDEVYHPSSAPQLVVDLFLTLRLLTVYKGIIPAEVSAMEAVEFYLGDNECEFASVDTLIHLLIPQKLKTKFFNDDNEAAKLFLQSILRRFAPNNFGILNELQTLVASGFYPNAAILNHSCSPNTILTYESNVLKIRLIKDVKEGEEVSERSERALRKTII